MRIFLLNLALTLFLLLPRLCYGTHLRAGEIQVRRMGCNSFTVQITLVLYVNTFHTTLPGGDGAFLFFGDGQSRMVEESPAGPFDTALNIGKLVFSVEHTYAQSGRYVISYIEPNRNDGVVNFSMSVNTPFQIETMILLEAGSCNTFPTLLNPPVDRACHRTGYFHNPAGFDADRDSLSYELAIPKRDNTTPVTNYLNPNHPSFYSSFAQGNEAGTGPPVFQINPVTGLLTWDAPDRVGEYSVAIKIREWKKNKFGSWSEVSYTIRDMQILVTECDNRKPVLMLPEELCVVAGEDVEFNVRPTDPDGDSLRLDFFSELFEIALYQPEITPPSTIGNYRPSPLELNFKLKTSCTMVRAAPYSLVMKVTDRRKGVTPLSRYHTIRIFVIAPPPKIENVNVNPVSRQVSLQWSIPACENVQAFQVWRRTSSIDYDESKCAKGMPAFLRYDLIAVVPPSQKTYTDNNLEIGSQYCYRIVTLVSGNNPGKLSLDTCLIPKPAEAPVITNVSVEDTDPLLGKISVKWTSPFEIDKTQYPPPYQYQVFRKNETLNTPFEPVGEPQSDTTFTDRSINTQQYSYRYFVELYVTALSTSPLDSSSQASSIVATAESKVAQIDLHWSAITPWSNYSSKHPYHLIFRSTKSDGPFELIDSINVLTNDFFYSDRGRYQDQELTRDPYFYKIKMRGTYGNPAVIDPLENFSAVFSGQVLDTIPPCAPIVEIETISCNQFSCDGKSYYTNLQWQGGDETCDEDVVGYEVLVKSDTAQHYTSLGMTTETSFRHSNLTNLDYCYRIVSIDHVGNRSDSSAVVCNSSCINFKLPNVITPGMKDDQNDFLAAYDGENSSESECARSVRKIALLVYNRWGDEIFLKEIANGETTILWPGINFSGIEVSAGTYFLKAKVEFQTSDPTKRRQEIKGWVHVLR